MKKKMIFILTLLLYVMVSCSSDSDSDTDPVMMMDDDGPMEARTSIPDIAFERALIELGLDDEEDGSVRTSVIEVVSDLVVEDKGITDLTGIDDFTMLEGLWLADNQLTTLDVTSNSNLLFLFARDNDLTEVNVSGLVDLEKIEVNGNELVSLDITDNTALQELFLHDNLLEAIDISNIPGTIQLNRFSVENNPLDCIKVNQDQLNDIPTQWTADPEDTYALDCP